MPGAPVLIGGAPVGWVATGVPPARLKNCTPPVGGLSAVPPPPLPGGPYCPVGGAPVGGAPVGGALIGGAPIGGYPPAVGGPAAVAGAPSGMGPPMGGAEVGGAW